MLKYIPKIIFIICQFLFDWEIKAQWSKLIFCLTLCCKFVANLGMPVLDFEHPNILTPHFTCCAWKPARLDSILYGQGHTLDVQIFLNELNIIIVVLFPLSECSPVGWTCFVCTSAHFLWRPQNKLVLKYSLWPD